MRTLQLVAAGTATASAVNQVTIPSAGKIKGVQARMVIDNITDNGAAYLELSKVPTSQIAVNGAQDPFLEIGLWGNFVTSGLAQTGVNQFFPMSVDVRQGEIIYVHATVTGTCQYYSAFIIHYE